MTETEPETLGDYVIYKAFEHWKVSVALWLIVGIGFMIFANLYVAFWR